MENKSFYIKAKVWMYEGESPWHFVTIDKKTSEEIKKFEKPPRRGFGSIPVEVNIGKTKWKTSIFPEKTGTYLLPLKKDVRKKENITNRDTLEIKLSLLI